MVILFLYDADTIYSQQEIKYLPVETLVYDFLDSQINSGKNIPKFVFRQPFELDRDFEFKKKQSGINHYFDKYWQKFYSHSNTNFYLLFSDQLKKDKTISNFYQAEAGMYYSSKHLTLVNQVAVDKNYKNDAYFAGDLSESDHWLYGRINEAYMNLSFDKFDFFIGRTKRNWGPIGEESLILSNNPYSYDHLLFNYSTKNIKLSLIYAQLENVDGYTFQYPDSLFKNCRKYLVGHRLDIRLKNNLQIAFTEMATYGGQDRDFEISFMNPMNFYYPIQRNDNKQMNGNWAVDVFYKPAKKLTLYSQFLIDDIIVNNEPGINDRANYPDRFAAMISLRSGDLIINGLTTSLTYNKVWNRTYQSKFTWENYHYRGLGLGYPCASCEEVKFKINYWGFFPFYLKNELIYGRYGSVNFTDLFPLEKEEFPIAPLAYNYINELNLYYFYNPSVRFYASFIYRDKPAHYSNRLGETAKFIFNLGFNVLFNRSLDIK